MVNKDKILVVDGVSKEYPGRSAVTDISFEVTKGSIHGFLGPNGAGKSTTMKMIAGLIPSTSGTITLHGEKVDPLNLELKNAVGFLPENPPLYMDMKVEDYLKYVARLHGMKNISQQTEKVMTELSLLEVRKRLIGNLSKGFKQRVGLAQAIIYEAPFLILDEPTNGLDPQTVFELREFIKRLSLEKTILFSSHVLSEVEQICDHITIIHNGRIRATGDLHEIHRKFKQGLVITLGIAIDETMPDLSRFGNYHTTHVTDLGGERQYHVVFEDDKDCRAEVGRFLISEGFHLYTMQVESPELEDIFLHLTEQKT